VFQILKGVAEFGDSRTPGTPVQNSEIYYDFGPDFLDITDVYDVFNDGIYHVIINPMVIYRQILDVSLLCLYQRHY
jgi:hypothetical protein